MFLYFWTFTWADELGHFWGKMLITFTNLKIRNVGLDFSFKLQTWVQLLPLLCNVNVVIKKDEMQVAKDVTILD